MRLLAHIALSAILSVIVYGFFGMTSAIFAFLVGSLLDGDHLIDFLLWSKNKSLRSFLVLGLWFEKPHITDTFLHSYELLLPFWGLISIFNAFNLGFGVTIGLVFHLISDQIYNNLRYGTSPLDYSFIGKIINHNNRLAIYEKRAAIYKSVLARDNYSCQACGSSKEPLEIHMENFAFGTESSDSYISVCPSCHTKKHVIVWKILNRLGIIKNLDLPFIQG